MSSWDEASSQCTKELHTFSEGFGERTEEEVRDVGGKIETY